MGSLGLIFGLGIVLYYHGKLEKLDDDAYTNKAQPFMTRAEIQKFQPDDVQRSTYKFFYVAILLFAVQVLAGILTVHDFVGFVHFFGFNISEALPITVTRSWHVQLSILWISACWIGASFFMMSLVSPNQPKRQVELINTIFWLTLLLVAGSFAGILTGPERATWEGMVLVGSPGMGIRGNWENMADPAWSCIHILGLHYLPWH